MQTGQSAEFARTLEGNLVDLVACYNAKASRLAAPFICFPIWLLTKNIYEVKRLKAVSSSVCI
jgi:hypothetical protein